METELDYLSGCSMLLPRAFLEEVGLMNEDYFLYYEEIDWFTRAAGRFDLLVAADAHLYHREGGSIGSRSWRRPVAALGPAHVRSRLHLHAALLPRNAVALRAGQLAGCGQAPSCAASGATRLVIAAYCSAAGPRLQP
jgi:hypothetical protein